MGQVVYDVYAYDDPNGSVLCRVTTSEAVELRFRLPELGFTMADGLIRIHSDHALATAANFHRHNLVKLSWVDDADVETELPFAFFLEEGDFQALSEDEEGGRILTFTGPNTIQYLDRAILREESFTTESIPFPDRRGGVNVDGMWTWGADADGREPGPIMVRAMEEGRDQPGAPLGEATWDFDRDEDSDGNPWDATGDEWQVPWGTTILDLLKIFMREGGLYWRSGRDLDYHAYNTDPGVDRTSATFATDKVRFEAGVNITTSVRRAIQGPVERSAMLVTGSDYQTAFVDGGSSDVPWVGHLDASSIAGPTRLEIAGQRNLDVRSEIADAAFPLTHIAGENEVAGLYVPGIHYVPGDLVRLHTGTNAHDFNEFDINVAAAGLFHDEAGNWFGIAELGAQSISDVSKAFEDRVGRVVIPHGLELCPIATYITAGDPARLYFDPTVDPGAPLSYDAAWNASDPPGLERDGELATAPAGHGPGSDSNDAVNLAADDYIDAQWRRTLSSGALLTALQGGGVMRMQRRASSRYGVGISESAQENYHTAGVRIFRSGSVFATLLTPGTAVGTVKFPAQAQQVNRSLEATLPANGSIASGDVLVVETGWHHVGPTTGGTGAGFNHTGNSASDLPEDDSTTTAHNDWIQFGGGGTTELVSPGVNSELAGDSIYAARCDHRHHVLRDTEPTVDDDEDAGYPEGTMWIVLDDLTTPTEILSAWLSVDGTTGAAVWLEWATGGGGAVGTDSNNIWVMSKTSSQTLTSNADTTITFDRSDIDSGEGVIDLANDRFVVPTTGQYLIIPHWMWESTVPLNGGRTSAFIGGSSVTPLIRIAEATVGANGTLQGVIPWALTAGDLVTMNCHPGGAVTPTARGNASRSLSTFFALIRLTGGGGGEPVGAVVAGTSTALGSGAYTALAFGSTDVYDPLNWHDPASNNTRITVDADGIYHLQARCSWPSNASANTDRRIAYRINGGSEVILVRERDSVSSSSTYLTASVDLDLNATDYVEVMQYTGIGSTTTVDYNASLFRRDSVLSTMGQWTSFTPTLTASTTNPTLGSTVVSGRYKQLDSKTYFVQWSVVITTGGAWNAGSGDYRLSLPSGLTGRSTSPYQTGSGWLIDQGTRYYSASCVLAPSGTYITMPIADYTGQISATGLLTWATNDRFDMSMMIEVQ